MCGQASGSGLVTDWRCGLSRRLQAALQAGLHPSAGLEMRQLQPLQPAVQAQRDAAAGRHDARLLQRRLRQEVPRLVPQGLLYRFTASPQPHPGEEAEADSCAVDLFIYLFKNQ